jgi:hypothetical protein
VTRFAFSRDSLHLAVYQPADGQIQIVELKSDKVTDCISKSLPPGMIEFLYFHPTEPALVIKMHPIYNYTIPVHLIVTTA